VRLENSNGSVELRAGKLPLAPMEISNRRGEIQVVLPSKATFELDASARRGDINSEFEGIKVDNSHNESRASGAVGSGGPRLQINNDNGNIEIRKAGSTMTWVPKTDRDTIVSASPAYEGPVLRNVSDSATVVVPAVTRKRVKRQCVFQGSGTL
jgi:hypothetical protein